MNYDRFYARYAYEALLLQQPHIQFDGLWQVVGPSYYILCPSLKNAPITVDGKPLAEWFNHECRPVGSPVRLAETIPEGSIRVPERTVEELSLLHGEPLTGVEVSREISATLPTHFPLSSVTAGNGKMVIKVTRPISDEERSDLEITISNLKIEIPYEIMVAPATEEAVIRLEPRLQALLEQGDLSLQAARSLANSIPTQLRHAYSEDEAFWVDNRLQLLTESSLTKQLILPPSFQENTSSCFINATSFSPRNIRTYLPIYHRIIIAMPLAECLETALKHFGITKTELLELVRRGRVQFLLPQPLKRYDRAFLADILDARPDALLFSRRLAMATVAESRARAPFLYPTFGSYERRKLLEAFESVNDPRIGPVARAMGRSLGQGWIGMERIISQQGATSSLIRGVGPFLGQVMHQLTGKDATIELAAAGTAIEWAASLNATYFPFEDERYSEAGAASLCASMYSGIRNAPLINPLKDFRIFVEGLLTINNDAPILEIDNVFTTQDINRLGAMLKRVDSENDSAVILRALNEKISRFERNQNRLNRLDIFSLGGAAAGAITSNIYIPLGVWVMQYILSKADPSTDVGGRTLDWLRAANSLTSPDTVLISRIRKKLQGNGS
jgi:hypothetical protein